MRIIATEYIGEIVEPITLQEAKDWCNYKANEQDENFKLVIKGVREFAENYMNQAIVAQRITAVTTSTDEYVLRLPKPPITSVVYVERIRNGNAEPYTGYTSIDAEHVELRPYWEGTLSEGWYKYHYRVTYDAGMNNAIPSDMKLGLLKMIKSCFDDRGNFVKGTIVSKLMENVELFLGPYRTSVEL